MREKKAGYFVNNEIPDIAGASTPGARDLKTGGDEYTRLIQLNTVSKKKYLDDLYKGIDMLPDALLGTNDFKALEEGMTILQKVCNSLSPELQSIIKKYDTLMMVHIGIHLGNFKFTDSEFGISDDMRYLKAYVKVLRGG